MATSMTRFTARPHALPGVYEVTACPRTDARGFFERVFCAEELLAVGFTAPIAQVNLSRNEHVGTIRGLHFQKPPYTEVKMVRCSLGRIFDVAVDLRSDSPTFLQHIAVELDAERHNALVLPKGVAHGFQSLSAQSEVVYFLSRPYAPHYDAGINALDRDLKIEWPLAVHDELRSARDVSLPSVAAFITQTWGGGMTIFKNKLDTPAEVLTQAYWERLA